MSDAPPEPVPAPPPASGAVLQELHDLSQKVDLVAGAVATIASGHHDLIERLAAMERAVVALPGAAPGVESTFVALADRLDALADGEREDRESIAALTAAVEALRVQGESHEVDRPADDAPDLRAELHALTEAQRAVADELAALGPRVNELLDRHPSGLPVPPPAPVDDDLVVPDEVTPPPSTEIDLAPLQGQVAELAEVASTQGHDLALALEVLTKVAEAIDRLDARTEDRLASIRDASMTPVADLHTLLVARSERSDAQMEELSELVAALLDVQTTRTDAEPAPVVEAAPADAAVLEKLEDLAQAVRSLTWQLPELADAVAALHPDDPLDTDLDSGAVAEEGTDPTEPSEGATTGSSAVLARLDDLVTAMDDLVPDPAALDARLDELTKAIEALATTTPPAVATPVAATSSDPLLEARLTHHIDTALAGVLRLFDDRLVALRAALTGSSAMSTMPVAPVAPAPTMAGFEAGAVMGAAQAAWSRLEQRLDTEFDDLSRQLQALASLVEHAVATTEALADRPVVTSDQFRKAAVSLRDTVVNANRQRRERRGGPQGLGPGSSDSGY